MMYDLFAEFYENSSEEPRYKVWLGSIFPHRDDELESMGFGEVIKDYDGFVDYVKEATEEDLEELTQSGFECEVLDVLDAVEYDRILIRAYALDVIDDEGNYDSMGVMVGNIFVVFTYTNPMENVWFCLCNGNVTERVAYCKIRMKQLKEYFHVLTFMEVKEKLSEMNQEKEWKPDELIKLFTRKKQSVLKRRKDCINLLIEEYERKDKEMMSAIQSILVPGEDLLRIPMYKVDRLIRIIEEKRNANN